MCSRLAVPAIVALALACAPRAKTVQTVHAQLIHEHAARRASIRVVNSAPANVEGASSLKAPLNPGPCLGVDPLLALFCATVVTGVDAVALAGAASVRRAEGERGRDLADAC